MQSFNAEIFNKNKSKLKKLLSAYYQRYLFQDGTPLVFSFLVTNRCFLKCEHCFYHETLAKSNMRKSPEELNIDEYRKLSHSMEWFLMGLFCGGEPFVREDLHEIIYIFRKNNQMPWSDSATNGQLTDEIVRQVELICKQDKDKVYSLSFSLDGFEEQNDTVRGKGTFKKSLETWKECKIIAQKYGNLELNFSTTMNSINQDSLAEFFKWGINNLEPDRITLLKTRQSPRAGEHLKDIELVNYKNARSAIGQGIKEGKLGDLNKPQTYMMISATNYVYKTMVTGKRSFICHAGKHGAWIDYNGDVNVCEIFPDTKVSGESLTMGNLRDYDLDFLKLWNSERALTIKQLVNKHKACEACTHETEGFIPSLYFEPNEISHIL